MKLIVAQFTLDIEVDKNRSEKTRGKSKDVHQGEKTIPFKISKEKLDGR